MRLSNSTASLLSALLLAGVSTTLSAAEEGQGWRDAPWRFNVNGYAWLPQAPVDIAIKGNDVASMPESFDNILSALEMAAMFEVEAHKGRIGFFASPIYYKGKASEHFTGALGQSRKATLEESAWIVKYGVAYDFGPFPLSQNAAAPTLTLQPYVGGLFLTDDIKVKVDPGLIDNGIHIDKTIDFNTPIVGLNTFWRFNDRWSLRVGANYGGWNVDDVRKTYEAIGTVAYRFKMGGVASKAFAGYRYLDVHYDDDRLGIQVTIKGPLIGIGWEF